MWALARPDNYIFAEGDVTKGLNFPAMSFDFVHQRLLVAALRAEDWPKAVAELVRLTRPGGWTELVEGDFSRGGGRGLSQINAWVDEACKRRGIDFSMGGRIGQMLQEAGCMNVRQLEVVVPMGDYGGHLGTMMQSDYFNSLSALQALVVGLGVTDNAAYQEAVRQAEREVAGGGVVVPFFVAFGQRP
jgi:hypothetical protein